MTIDSIALTVLPVDQPIGRFYVGAIKASELLKLCRFDFRRMTFVNGYLDFLGMQRRVDPKRRKQIAAFVQTVDACFPTSVVISIDERCVFTDADDPTRLFISSYEDPEDPSLSIPLEHAATIVDGQHRMKGIQDSGVDFDIAVSIFVGIDDAIEALLFSKVNLAQTKVNRSLVYDLFSAAHERSPEKTCHEITVALDRSDKSPFEGLIKRLGAATDGRFGETLSQATIVKGILPYVTADAEGDRDRGKRFGFWEPISPRDHSKRIFYEFFRTNQDAAILEILINYFTAVAERWPEAWKSSGQGIMIKRTNGFNGFCRFLRPAYRYYTSGNDIVTKSQFAALFGEVNLKSEDFNVQRFAPGTSGSSELYKILMKQTKLDQI
jgi:DGQHR domain-containing protein